MRQSGNTILITGGTAGIGRALAERFHGQGNQVIIAGRRQSAIDEILAANPGMTGYAADMTDEAGIDAFAARVIADHPGVNVVIANAGIMRREDATRRRDMADAMETITTNLIAPIRLINALVDHLSAQKDSAIVTVSSGLAFVPLAFTPTYCATKAAIHSYSQSLRYQLDGKVEVIELAPPAVQTDLTPGQSTREDYMPLGQFIDAVMEQFSRQPTPAEMPIQRAQALRTAEAEGRFDATFKGLNDGYRKYLA